MDILPQDNTPRKKCKGPCGEWLPATPEFFHRGNGKYGIKAICKKCRAKPNEGAIVDGMKKCSNPDCENPWLPATTEYFYGRKGNTSKDGLNRQCIACVKKRVTARYQENPEVRERKKEYDSQPEIREREYKRRKQPKARARHREWARMRYHEVPGVRESILAYSRLPEVQARRREREWTCYQHPEQRLRKQVKDSTRRARKNSIPGTYTAEEVQEQLKRQHYRCYYAACGFSKFPRVKKNGKWKYTFDVEHTFPISRVAGSDIPANSMSYLVLACESCNSSKGDKYPWEWPQGGRLL